MQTSIVSLSARNAVSPALPADPSHPTLRRPSSASWWRLQLGCVGRRMIEKVAGKIGAAEPSDGAGWCRLEDLNP